MTTKRYVDLHLHTNHSDGLDTPARVVERAAQKKLSAIAITDHDTTTALAEAQAAAHQAEIELLPAVEISSGLRNAEVHILAYGVRLDDEPMQQALSDLRQKRATRAEAILAKLATLGVMVPPAQLAEEAGAGAVGRLHIARILRLRGYTKTVQEGFDRFIGEGRPAFVPKATLPVAQAIELIHAAGGVAVVAHPGLNAALKKLLPQLLLHPFDGLEVYHVHHSPGESAQFMELAQANNLLITGGSDCHGNIKGQGYEMGKVRLAYEHYQRLKDTIERKA